MDILEVVKDYERIHDAAIYLACRELYGDNTPDELNISTIPNYKESEIVVIFTREDDCGCTVFVSLKDIENHINLYRE